jgi:hypothetical protein
MISGLRQIWGLNSFGDGWVPWLDWALDLQYHLPQCRINSMKVHHLKYFGKLSEWALFLPFHEFYTPPCFFFFFKVSDFRLTVSVILKHNFKLTIGCVLGKNQSSYWGFFFPFFFSVWGLNSGFHTLFKEALCYFSHAPSPFCFSYFSDRMAHFGSGWPRLKSSYLCLPCSWDDRRPHPAGLEL